MKLPVNGGREKRQTTAVGLAGLRIKCEELEMEEKKNVWIV